MALVSVCIPAFRAAETLGATIASVVAQTHDDWELVIVDDHSDDETLDVARGFDDERIRVVVSGTTIGMASNFERAVAETKAAFVKLLCADDLIAPDCLQAQLEILDNDPRLALTSGRRDIIGIDGAVLSPGRGIPSYLIGRRDGPTVIRRVFRSGYNPIGEPACVLFRREAKDRAGPFSGLLPGPTDLDMWFRLLGHGDFYGDRRTVASFRLHARSLTATTYRSYGNQDRTMFRRMAADPAWRVGRPSLAVAYARSFLHQAHRAHRHRHVGHLTS